MKAYVVNANNKWNDIQIDFSDTSIKLVKWDMYKYKNASSYATLSCNTLCSKDIIYKWLAHKSLWTHIYKNSEPYAIILEDDAVPIDNFEHKLKLMLSEAPQNWDIMYIGCTGSCDANSFADEVLSKVFSAENKYVYKDNEICKHIIKPGHPVGTYAYILSYTGAKKLLYDDNLKQVSGDLSSALCKYVVNNDNYSVYAIVPPLIYMDFDANKDKFTHKLIKPITEKIKISKQLNLYDALNIQVAYFDKIQANITLFSLLLFTISFVVGYLSPKNIKKYFTFAIMTYLFIDMTYSKNTNSSTTEIIIIISIIIASNKLAKYAKP